ncbi:Helix-turn-helix domain-containing protein [Actinopolyspora lacussalsi subsp. righensis]|uniref:Helix-turn-helix domain-containing protein n=1 Tax=Actinopolyspora righensis TaxID=995060 RepID=A0A1I7BRM0_9ACTN|nr:helix-turn-helix transcriptional regulator [Actinopolyspora righensis]SFT89820.1 Helix-turn-helix domain-containing protein [Actinopolyspora righensis]
MAPPSSTVAAWELGLRLREEREALDFTAVEAAGRIGIAQNYLSDIERGKRKISEAKLDELIDVYGLDAEEYRELVELRSDAVLRGWWSKFSGLFDQDVLRYFGYEHGAEAVRTYESLLIPGLLQTNSYARAVISSDTPNIPVSEVERRVEARAIRQQRLFGEEPLRLTVAISEAALRQQVGGPEVHAEQLEHLIKVIEQLPESLKLLVVPFDAGAHGALGASTFHIVSFPSPKLPNLVWQETVTSTDVIDNPIRVHQYSLTYEEVVKHAYDRSVSLRFIREALGG